MLTKLQREIKFLNKLTKNRWHHTSKFKTLRLLKLNQFECRICKNILDISNTYKTQGQSVLGHINTCKDCHKKRRKIYYKNNKKRQIDRVSKYNKINRKQHYNYIKKWQKVNKHKVKQYAKDNFQKKYYTDPMYKLAHLLRSRTKDALKSKKWNKNNSLKTYLGCSLEELKQYMESKFKMGMVWDNHGEWHIDHIIPLASAKTEEDLYKLCHYTNLQPLWAIENIKKGKKT